MNVGRVSSSTIKRGERALRSQIRLPHDTTSGNSLSASGLKIPHNACSVLKVIHRINNFSTGEFSHPSLITLFRTSLTDNDGGPGSRLQRCGCNSERFSGVSNERNPSQIGC